MKVDYLFFGAHPDDVELSCSGTILEAIHRGKKIGIVDLTLGEMGSRGNVEIRKQEATLAAEKMGITIRKNLHLQDVFFENNQATILKVVSILREFQPEYVFANALEDRHPDHKKAAQLISDACFLSGLRKIETKNLSTWKPKCVFFYIQDKQLNPEIVIDISAYFEKKIEIIGLYKSQFYNPSDISNEPQTYISSQLFLKNLEAKARAMGQKIGVEFGEGYNTKQCIGLKNIESVLPNFF